FPAEVREISTPPKRAGRKTHAASLWRSSGAPDMGQEDRRPIMRRLFSIALLSIGLFAAPVTHAAQITLIWTSETGTFAPIWVTKEARLFEKYGNQVQLVFIQGAAAAAAAVISNDAQIGSFSPQVVLTSAMQGLDLTMIGRLGNSMDNRIFGRRGVTDIK